MDMTPFTIPGILWDDEEKFKVCFIFDKKKQVRPTKNSQDAQYTGVGPEQLNSSILGWPASCSLPTTGDSMLKIQRSDSVAPVV